MSGDELVAFYVELANPNPIISIEDGCAENDWKNVLDKPNR